MHSEHFVWGCTTFCLPKEYIGYSTSQKPSSKCSNHFFFLPHALIPIKFTYTENKIYINDIVAGK